jgi:hypothetical protein
MMAHFLFIDESGHDAGPSPYEVLAGFAVEDRDLWNFVQALHDSELRHFGIRYSAGTRELKAKKILKRKVFRHASECEQIDQEERRELAKSALQQGSLAGFREMCGLAQAKISYVNDILEICSRFRCRAFASIISDHSSRDLSANHLRKDYAYLFERFYYFLEDNHSNAAGIIVFDELEKSKSHILVGQMDSYFKKTAKGRQRADQIIPEPFFVHSDLTTGIQVADLIAYLLSWGFRTGDLIKPVRKELSEMVDRLCRLRYRATRTVGEHPRFDIWSFAVIPDLRTRAGQEEPL